MKEVIKVSISGIAFTFDDDAYRVMSEYLKKLETGYAKHPDGREIIADIEARIAELILEHQESDKVIGVELARSIVNQLGYPDDMDDGKENPVEEFPRRFYRNPEGARLAGICSGLGAYFRMDPIWIRLGIFAPVLLGLLGSSFRWGDFWYSLFGVVVLLYIVLWIVVPMAKNPRQKLEMRGEKITADSIRQSFEDEASAMSGSEKGRKNASVWADIVYVFGRILQIFLKVIVFFIAFVLGVVGISLLIAVISIIFGLGAGVSIMGLSLTGASFPAYSIILILILVIPLFVLVYWLVKVIFSSRTNRPFLITVWSIWTILLIWFIAITARNADTIRYEVRDIIEHIDDGTFDDYLDRWDARYDDGEYILFDSDARRIRRTDGGPVTVEKRNGRKVIMVLPESADGMQDEIPENTGESDNTIPPVDDEYDTGGEE